MKEIGGYFELELSAGDHQYHDTPYTTQSGRIALRLILHVVQPKLVYIPYFSCKVLLDPFIDTGIPYKFYEVTKNLDPVQEVELQDGEYFLYINYFDLKRDTLERLSVKYKDRLIADCTMAFFIKGNGTSWFFNSCRKFFGVPDGAYIYAPDDTDVPAIDEKNEDYITDHLLLRFNGHTNAGYEHFLKNEELVGQGVKAMAKLSSCLMSQVNYSKVIEKRLENYYTLCELLNDINDYPAPECTDGVPQFYPFVTSKLLRSQLISNKIYLSVIWPGIDTSLAAGAYEHYLTDHLLPLPIDHRYDVADMEHVASLIKELLK